MEEKEFKYLLKKYLKGTASKAEIERIEKFEYEVNKTAKTLKEENLAETKNRIYKKIEDRLFIKNQYWIKMAASFLILVGLGVMGLWFGADSTRTIGNNSTEIKHIELIDGTKIILNQGSQISFNESDFNRDLREIGLDGEAFFEVASNKEKPFIINTGNLTTQVVGTEFNIKENEDFVHVTVTEGKVKVFHKKDTLKITKNEQATYHLASQKLNENKVNARLFSLWQKNEVVLNNITLMDFSIAIKELYDIPFIFKDNKAKNKLMSITFEKSEPLEDIIKRINLINEVELILNKQHIMEVTLVK